MHTSIRGIVAASLLAGCGFAAAPALAQDSSVTAPPAATDAGPVAPAAAPAPTPAFTVTGSAAVVSQYRFRGLAQSDNKPVVQASFTLTHSSGFYLATWGSSATSGRSCSSFFFESCTPINIGGTEIDVYGGFTHALGKSGITVDVGGYGYIYPGATAGNYYEIYGSLSGTYGPVTAKVGVNVAPKQRVFHYNFTSPTQHNVYVYGELGGGIPGTPLSFHSHLGHTGGGFDWGKQYLDYVAGVTYKWKALAFDISIVGTNVKKSDINRDFGCFAYAEDEGEEFSPAAQANCIKSFNRMSKTVAVGSITASF